MVAHHYLSLSSSLSRSLSFSLQHRFKTTDFRASRPTRVELPTTTSSSSSSSSGAFVVFLVSHLYTRAHAGTSFNAMISREDGAYFIIRKWGRGGKWVQEIVLVHLPHGFEKKRAGQ